MSSAQGCRKPLPWLHREAISYLSPPSPQYKPMVQGLTGSPRSLNTRAEATVLCRGLQGLGGCPMAQGSWLILLLALLAGSNPRAIVGADVEEAPMPALATYTCRAWPACRLGWGTPAALVLHMGTPSPSHQTSPGPAAAPDIFPGLSFL